MRILKVGYYDSVYINKLKTHSQNVILNDKHKVFMV